MTTTQAPPDTLEIRDDEALDEPVATRTACGLVRRIAMRPRRVLVRVHRWLAFVLLGWLVDHQPHRRVARVQPGVRRLAAPGLLPPDERRRRTGRVLDAAEEALPDGRGRRTS